MEDFFICAEGISKLVEYNMLLGVDQDSSKSFYPEDFRKFVMYS
jgi:hypothetical protein